MPFSACTLDAPVATPDAGVVTTVAGTGARGGSDGPAEVASFTLPVDIVVAFDRCLYVTEPEAGRIRARPLSFLEAVAFQWVNPKAWTMMFSGVALFAAGASNHALVIALMAGLFGLACLPNGVAWTLFGAAISRFLADDVWRRRFNLMMAILLVLSVVPALF